MEEITKPAQLEIFYEKNPLYRSIYSDGVYGGVTPTNSICLSFYATRNAIPKSVIHQINSDGTLNPSGELGKDSKLGIIREVEISIYMNNKTAEELYQFLKHKFESHG